MMNQKILKNLNEFSVELNLLSKQKMLNKSFFNSWNHVKSPHAECHPRVLGAIVKTFSHNYKFYDIDNFIYYENFSWKPDLTFYDENGKIQLIFDYESPNSSDDRIIEKDFEKYKTFCEKSSLEIPYIILTTLPNENEKEKWKLRRDKNHSLYKTDTESILQNPRDYWIKFYLKWLNNKNVSSNALKNIWLFNLRPTAIEEIFPKEELKFELKLK